MLILKNLKEPLEHLKSPHFNHIKLQAQCLLIFRQFIQIFLTINCKADPRVPYGTPSFSKTVTADTTTSI